MKILLAEDNVVNQRVAVGLLAKRGHQVTIANNGIEALQAIARTQFDLVLMDLQMPAMGGLEATATIRAHEREVGGHLRIVAVTAHAMKEDRERCLAAGMDGYLSKPVNPQLLFDTVENDHQPAANRDAASSLGAAIDRDDAVRRFGGDDALFDEIVHLFLADCPARVSDIKAAVNAGDAEGIRTSAHALKGAAANLSATGLCQAAHQLEVLGAEGRIDEVPAAWLALTERTTQVMNALRQYAERPTAATRQRRLAS